MAYKLLEQNSKKTLRERGLQFLLRREFLFQLEGRQSYTRAVYPGINWFALLSAAIILFGFNASRSSPKNSIYAIDYFAALALCLLLLIALRSAVYCALSMARDIQNHTITVVRVSPIPAAIALIAKLCACLFPLWLEQLLLLPISLAFFTFYLGLPYIYIVATLPITLSISLLAGCLGLAVGSFTSIPQQAIRNARISFLLGIFLIPLLQSLTTGWLIPVSSLWLWIFIITRRAPNRFTVLTTCMLLTGLAWLIGSSQYILSHLPKQLFHPLTIFKAFHKANPQPDVLASIFIAILAYAVLSLAFFLIARSRYSYAR